MNIQKRGYKLSEIFSEPHFVNHDEIGVKFRTDGEAGSIFQKKDNESESNITEGYDNNLDVRKVVNDAFIKGVRITEEEYNK